jgi:3-methyl-2-oxobutanoate hydroxymethyltransferase
VFAAIGYLAAALDDTTTRYANVAEIALTAITAFSDDVRSARQIRGTAPGANRS